MGAALGLSLKISKLMEMQFADFVTVGFNQIINNLAKIYYRWAQQADVVIHMPTGGGVGAGRFHSENNEAWFVHTPGLKVVYPSTPMDQKACLSHPSMTPIRLCTLSIKVYIEVSADLCQTNTIQLKSAKQNVLRRRRYFDYNIWCGCSLGF